MSSSFLFTFRLILIWSALLIFFSIGRLFSPHAGIDQYLFGSFANVINLGLLIACIGCISIYIINFRKTNYIVIASALMAAYGLIIGINNNPANMAKHAYLVVFCSAFFWFGRIITFYVGYRSLKQLMHIALISNVAATLLFYLISISYKMYPGFGVQTIGYVALYFFAHKKYMNFSISLMVLVAQGKRSILIACLLCTYIAYIWQKTRSKKATFLSLLIFPVLITASLFIIDKLDLYSIAGLSRVSYINPFSSNFDIFLGSSGRVDEIVSAFATTEPGIRRIIGYGFGFEYEWLLSYREDFSETKGYLHMSPMTIYFVLGPIAVVVFYYFFYRLISTSFSTLRNLRTLQAHNNLLFLSLCSIYFMTAGFFSLNILSDIMGWILVGMCYGTVHKLKHSSCAPR